jgi:hypothetical protein
MRQCNTLRRRGFVAGFRELVEGGSNLLGILMMKLPVADLAAMQPAAIIVGAIEHGCSDLLRHRA